MTAETKLASALKSLLQAIGRADIGCEHLHHEKSDRHKGLDCPVVAMVESAISTAREALETYHANR